MGPPDMARAASPVAVGTDVADVAKAAAAAALAEHGCSSVRHHFACRAARDEASRYRPPRCCSEIAALGGARSAAGAPRWLPEGVSTGDDAAVHEPLRWFTFGQDFPLGGL